MSHVAAAPVAACELAIADGRIIGYAAPATGLIPCVLRLEADGETIAIGRAACFSNAAAAAEVRFGWCGVTLDGLDEAAALADRFAVRCVDSGTVLLEAETPTPSLPPVLAPPLTVHDILAHARRAGTCDDIACILPFAEETLRRHGLAAMLEATYRSLLGRAADAPVITRWVARPPPDPARTALTAIVTAPEFRDDARHVIPGPFHSSFAFDRSLLDQ